eukprot:scaffold383_cov131-Skeletonema_marinoi.AAC.7
MIVGADLFLVVIATSVITFGVNQFGNEWLSFLSDSKPAIGTLGGMYFLSLVFRTNICYSRWWEGRVLWGTIIISSIRIAQQAHLWIKEPALVGLPVAYDDILNTTGAIFLTAACLAWAPGAGLYNPILVLIVYTIAKMIIGVGSDDDIESGRELSETDRLVPKLKILLF